MKALLLRHRRDVSLLLLGGVLASVLITPAGAHVTQSVSHLWTGHIKSKVTSLVYTKTQSNARYLGRTATAANANLLGGEDSTTFLRAERIENGVVDGANGTGTFMHPGASVARTGTGTYTLDLAAYDGSCTLVLSLENAFGFVRADFDMTNVRFNVFTSDTAGTAADRNWDFIAHCHSMTPPAGINSVEGEGGSRP